jgi:hypothetical protein
VPRLPAITARHLLASLALVVPGVAPGIASAQDGFAPPPPEPTVAPAPPRIDQVFRAADPDAQRFHEHVQVLASPWMAGRLPGTRGMELASEYMEWNFRRTGLEPGYTAEDGTRSYRQPFRLGGKKTFEDAVLAATPAGGAEVTFARDTDWKPTSLGEGGASEGELVFVGYGIDDGPDGYVTFAEGDDLSGRIAMVLRFEPMDENGKSRWATDGWSSRSGFAGKLRNVANRKPAAILVVNTPGADDPRTGSLDFGGQRIVEGVPVFALTADAADRLVRMSDPNRGILDLRKAADAAGGLTPLPGPKMRLAVTVQETPVIAENVVGVLPGRGSLKDEVIVIGGHLDHLGMGDFGSRSGEKALHPGADDNASGSAGVMMLGDSLKAAYDKEDPATPLRTIVFVGFSAEESGLNGSEHYVKKPIFPIDRTVLMFNYDMIGRIEGERLSVSGAGTGIGMEEWAKGHYERREAVDGLKVIPGRGSGGGSDHASFLAAGVPVLFAIIADFHAARHRRQDQFRERREGGAALPRHGRRHGEAARAVRLQHRVRADAAAAAHGADRPPQPRPGRHARPRGRRDHARRQRRARGHPAGRPAREVEQEGHEFPRGSRGRAPHPPAGRQGPGGGAAGRGGDHGVRRPQGRRVTA